jgi:hypothetical protein
MLLGNADRHRPGVHRCPACSACGHASDWERQCDAQRRNEMIDQGLKMYEYTRGQVDDRPEWVAATMRERLTAAGWAP